MQTCQLNEKKPYLHAVYGFKSENSDNCSFPTRTFDATGNPLKTGVSDEIAHIANNLSTQLSDAILVKLIKQWSSLNENQVIEIQKIIEKPKS